MKKKSKKSVRLYDLRKDNFPDKRGDDFRSLQVFTCWVCGVVTNRVVMRVPGVRGPRDLPEQQRVLAPRTRTESFVARTSASEGVHGCAPAGDRGVQGRAPEPRTERHRG